MADNIAYEGQIVREAPEIEAYKLGLLSTAQQLYGQPLNLPAVEVAGLSQGQQQAIQLAQQGIGAYQPYLQAGSSAITQGQRLAQQAAQATGGMDVAGLYAPARALYGGTTGTFDTAAAQQYMDPYQQEVTNQALKEIQRQADISAATQAAQAVQAGAFGGGREGVQRAEFQRGVLDLKQQRIAQDLAQNFQQARAAFEAEQARKQQAALGIGNLAQSQSTMGLQQAGQLGTLGSTIGQMGVQQGALGQAASQLGAADVQLLAGIGGLQQQNAQAQLDAIRATQLQRSMAPYQQLAFVSDIYKGAPSSQMTLTSQSAPSASPLQSLIGTGIGALSAYTGAQKAGLF